ncbi:MFS transporter [Amycolatopsis benzoatilytica]|uniref:MFS transporter n=1 Tax=Amycolatopsis benzoatilytica TaxID=346045 RepID=UPI0003798850|nr:MFS transporter [Amycolatopsis benzoatilytica]
MPATTERAEPDPQRWRALWVCLIAGFMTLLDVSIVNVALPSMERGIGATPADVSWVVSGYALTFGLALVPAGRLGDDYGRRRMFLVGLALFVATSALCGAAPNATWLVVARLCQGIAGGLLNPQIIGMMQQLFSGRERGKAFGAYGAVVGLSTAVGPVLGGLLIQGIGIEEGWRWVFYVNLPIGLLAILFGLRLLPKDARSGRKRTPDLVGTALLGVAVVLVMLPLIEEEEQAASPRWWLMGVAAALLVGFVLWERWLGNRGKQPLVNLKLLTVRSYSMGSALGLVYFAGFTGIFLVLTLFFQQGLGYTALQAGAAMLAFAIGSAISPAIGGRLVHRFGRPMVVLGTLLAAIGLAGTAWLVRDYSGTGTALVLAGPLFVGGFGSGLVISPNSTLTLEEVPPAEGGTAAGVLQTGQRIGSAVGTALGGSLFFGQLGRSHGDYHAATALGLIGSTGLVVLALLFGVVDVVLSRTRKARRPKNAGPVRLTGTVRAVRGPFPGAQVAVLDADGQVQRVTVTDDAGRYVVDDLFPGVYTVVVTGYEPSARPVRLTSEGPGRFDPLLRLASAPKG